MPTDEIFLKVKILISLFEIFPNEGLIIRIDKIHFINASPFSKIILMVVKIDLGIAEGRRQNVKI
jgi:hypothetical protein